VVKGHSAEDRLARAVEDALARPDDDDVPLLMREGDVIGALEIREGMYVRHPAGGPVEVERVVKPHKGNVRVIPKNLVGFTLPKFIVPLDGEIQTYLPEA
jgi:hypothetical protein